MGLFHRFVVGTLPLVPRPVMRALSSRYIAGETLQQALTRLQDLQTQGFSGILDILGEDVADESAAHGVVEAYSAAAEAVTQAGLDAYISIKPTHLGLRLSEEFALDRYRELAARCREMGRFVRVEMEDHSTTDATLRIYSSLRAEFDNVGLVLQSRLFRTPADIDALEDGYHSVRMVKGIYLESAEVGHVAAREIDDAFVACVQQLFARGAYVSLATHDGPMAERILRICEEGGIGTDRYEMQVLMGVREPLWSRWKDAGHPVRVYVPYGPEWRAYSTRRLGKNPQILRHLMRDFFTPGKG